MQGFGQDVFQSWSEEQRRDEIGKLIQGYRNGLPIHLLCRMAVDIAGSDESVKGHFSALLTQKERKAIVKKEAKDDADFRALLSTLFL